MQIEKDKVVAFHYRLYEGDQVVESSFDGEQMLYLHGKAGLLEGLQTKLEGKIQGDKVDVTLLPEEAYGIPKPDAQQRIPVKHLASKGKIRPGDVVQVNTQQGPRDVTVIKVGHFNVDVDTNHPLAGKTLRFEIEVGEVRDATKDELSHGHAHGVGGHNH